jgi:eukaryotic-like serine/threonine-protein kinase
MCRMEQPVALIGEGSDGPPRESDRYRVIRRLGSGGAADVFLAVARGMGGFQKLVVLKKPRTTPADAAIPRNLFFHEARIAARLNHPNCAQVIGIEEIDGVPVIIFEYLEGLTLSALRSQAGPHVPLEIELSILHDVLLGLQHAHELRDFDGAPLGVVHRDVSPQNILVTYDGEVKVLDFGIAKANRQTEQTEVGVIKGKLRYMAPEQVSGLPADPRTDVFAAGIVLWEALTHQRLWAGVSDAKLLQHAMAGSVPPPRSLAPDAPDELERICLRATAPEMRDRFHSAQEMAAALANATRELRLPSGRELLASYLDAHFMETRRAVRAEVESELTDLSHRDGAADEAGSAPWKMTSSRVSIAPELAEPGLPDDSLEASAVAVPNDPALPEVAASPGPYVEPESRGLLIGGLLGFLACAVALLAWNRFAPEPAEASNARASSTKDPSLTRPLAKADALPRDGPAPQARASASSGTPEPRPSPSAAPSSLASASRVARPKASARSVGPEPSPTEPVATPAAPTSIPAPGCEVPFELTPDGFKRFKPECLPRSP